MKNKQKILYASCSEVVMRLSLPYDENKELDKFINKLMKRFQPYSNDPLICNTFVFYDDVKNEMLFRARDETFEDDGIEEECKKLKIKIEQIGGKYDTPLYSENNNFYYSINGDVKVVNLDYTGNKIIDKTHKELLNIWERRELNKAFKEEQGEIDTWCECGGIKMEESDFCEDCL